MEEVNQAGDKRVDYRALWRFLAISFGGAWAVVLTLDSIWPYSAVGLTISHSTAMLMPGIGAIAANKYIKRVPVLKPGWYRGSATAAVIIILACAGLWGIPWLIDIIWGGSKFVMPGYGLMVWIIVSAFGYLIPAFGEELGWRGFLLPELLPVGTVKAVTIHGAIWGVWHWPIVIAPFIHGVFAGKSDFKLDQELISVFAALPAMVLASILLGVIFGYIAMRFGGLLLVTLMHAYYDYFRDTLGMILVPGKHLYQLLLVPFAVIIIAGVVCFSRIRKMSIQGRQGGNGPAGVVE